MNVFLEIVFIFQFIENSLNEYNYIILNTAYIIVKARAQ